MNKSKAPEVIGLTDSDDEAGGDDDWQHALTDVEAEELERIAEEVSAIDEQIAALKRSRTKLVGNRDRIVGRAHKRGGSSSAATIDFYNFESSHLPRLAAKARKFWPGFRDFRYCQAAVCKAAMEGRDMFVILPTGGGKSLCYQLPAICSEGVTLVVSPLISLMMDQVMHLEQAGIPCEFLAAASSKEKIKEVHLRVRDAAARREKPIKLLYVTPERIVKAKTLRSALQAAYEQGALSRIVLDEAHCCSSQGHDFRPDYRELDALRSLFPKCPISLLSATAGPDVIEDVINVMRMPAASDGHAALPRSTVLFKSPLLRANLSYSVRMRAATSDGSIDQIAEFITTNHAKERGLIYCFSQKDSEVMAEQLEDRSGGTIICRPYNAGMMDSYKEKYHRDWSVGKIHVICATSAFGMGIDQPDVRFVIHPVLPRSPEALYQESGRAGRDGNPSDCVVFYRPSDASRVASLTCLRGSGEMQLRSILDYCQGTGCRSAFFCKYFDDEYGKDMKSCGQCDNCLQETDMESRDVSFEAWKAISALARVKQQKGRVTFVNLCDLVRGLGGGKFNIFKKKAASTGHLDLEQFGGKVAMNRDEVERLIIELFVRGYIALEFQQTPYTVNVYMTVGAKAHRLSRLQQAEAEKLKETVVVNFAKQSKGRAAKKMPVKKNSRGAANGRGGDGDADESIDSSDLDDRPLAESAPKKTNGRSKLAKSVVAAAPVKASGSGSIAAPPRKKLKIAVLPMVDLTSDAESQQMANGAEMSDEEEADITVTRRRVHPRIQYDDEEDEDEMEAMREAEASSCSQPVQWSTSNR